MIQPARTHDHTAFDQHNNPGLRMSGEPVQTGRGTQRPLVRKLPQAREGRELAANLVVGAVRQQDEIVIDRRMALDAGERGPQPLGLGVDVDAEGDAIHGRGSNSRRFSSIDGVVKPVAMNGSSGSSTA